MRKIKNFMFYIGIFLMQFSIYAKNITAVSEKYSSLFNISIYILLFCSLLTLILIKATKKNWLIYFLLLAISFISYIITKDYTILILVISIFSTYGMNFTDIIKKDIIFKTLLFIIIFFAYQSGNVNETFFIRKGEMRYALGFSHPNNLGFYALMYYFEFINLIFKSKTLSKNKKTFSVIVLNIVTFYLMNVAKSRTSELCMIIFNIISLISIFRNKNIKLKHRKSKSFPYALLYVGLTLLSLYLTVLFAADNGISIKLNEFLSNRLSIQNQFLNIYNFKLFGNYVDYVVTLDNSYMRILLNYGIINWIIYGYIFTKILSMLHERNDVIVKDTIIILMVYGLTEWFTIRPVFNIFLLLFFETLYLKKGENHD